MYYFFISYHTVLYCMYYSILCITVQYKDSIIPVGSGVSLSGQLANPHVELTSCPYIILLPTLHITPWNKHCRGHQVGYFHYYTTLIFTIWNKYVYYKPSLKTKLRLSQFLWESFLHHQDIITNTHFWAYTWKQSLHV